MARQEYLLTNTSNKLSVTLSFEPMTVAIDNTSRFPIYIRIGSVSTPNNKSFSNVILPFSNYQAAVGGIKEYSIVLDNSSDPSTSFTYPVAVVFTTEAAAAQSALGLASSGVVNSAYIAKVLATQSSFLLDFWGLDDQNIIAIDRVSANRNGVYINSPLLHTVLAPDNETYVPLFNGTNQYVNCTSPSFQANFTGSAISIMVWVQMTVADWGNATVRPFFFTWNAALIGFAIMKPAANTVSFECPGVSSASLAITASNNWFCFVMTFNKAANRTRGYTNGVQVYTDTAPTAFTPPAVNTYIGARTNSPTQFIIDSMAFCAVWNTELTAAEALIVSTAP